MTTENNDNASHRAHFVFHGHFYQPPRENPWTDEVEREPSAHPFHDWNARINAECYACNAASRVHDERGRIERIENNYERISFNFGPTLLRWLNRNDPRTLGRIIEADRKSAARNGGRGNAVAQAYNHMILALADPRDRRTQIVWGLREFQSRFDRPAEALWLPETAANHAVLDELIEHELRYVILAPSQAGRIRNAQGDEWHDVRGEKVDPSRSYRYLHRDGSGRSLAVFFYDGPLARAVSFGGALKDGKNLGTQVESAHAEHRSHSQLVHLAVDGETAGHHVGFGNLALTWALENEIPSRGFEVTNYGAFLDTHPPQWDVELDEGPFGEGSSWSCAHGVGRWIRDCSCRIDPSAPTQQAWRGPLRDALDLIRDRGRVFFEAQATGLLNDPWAARDDYVELLLSSKPGARIEFFERHAAKILDPDEVSRALALLEMQHQCMLMYTSCAWFFDDIGGLESVQVLRYAARALEIWEQLGGESCRDDFVRELSRARSNDRDRGTGADIFRRDAMSVRVTPERIAAHLAMRSLLGPPPENGQLALHRFERRHFHLREREGLRLVTAHFVLEHVRTLQATHLQVVMLHTGALDFVTAVSTFDEDSFQSTSRTLRDRFETGSAAELRAAIDRIDGGLRFGAEDLLESGRQDLFENVFHEVIDQFSAAYSELYEQNGEVLRQLHSMGMVMPEELRAATSFTLRKQFEREFLLHADDTDPHAHVRAVEIVRDALARDVRLDSPMVRRHLQRMLEERVVSLAVALAGARSEDLGIAMRQAEDLLDTADELGLELDLSASQTEFFDGVAEGHLGEFDRASIESLDRFGERIGFVPELAKRRVQAPTTVNP